MYPPGRVGGRERLEAAVSAPPSSVQLLSSHSQPFRPRCRADPDGMGRSRFGSWASHGPERQAQGFCFLFCQILHHHTMRPAPDPRRTHYRSRPSGKQDPHALASTFTHPKLLFFSFSLVNIFSVFSVFPRTRRANAKRNTLPFREGTPCLVTGRDPTKPGIADRAGCGRPLKCRFCYQCVSTAHFPLFRLLCNLLILLARPPRFERGAFGSGGRF